MVFITSGKRGTSPGLLAWCLGCVGKHHFQLQDADTVEYNVRAGSHQFSAPPLTFIGNRPFRPAAYETLDQDFFAGQLDDVTILCRLVQGS